MLIYCEVYFNIYIYMRTRVHLGFRNSDFVIRLGISSAELSMPVYYIDLSTNRLFVL